MGRTVSKKSVKVIFNPMAGMARRERAEAGHVAGALEALGFEPELCVLRPGLDARDAAREALAQGFPVVAACGGDGTVSAVAGALAGGRAALAIVPTGSQNNMALSMGIPEDVAGAAALLRTGRRRGVDVGVARCAGGSSHFMEVCSVGLISALSPSGDAIQHGRLTSLGDFLATFISSLPADMRLTLDGCAVEGSGHIALVTNMPYVGFHYRVGRADAYRDGRLDVHFYNGLGKLDLLKYVTGSVYLGKREDPRIRHFRASCVGIETGPAMPVMVDGRLIGESPAEICVIPKALRVFCGK